MFRNIGSTVHLWGKRSANCKLPKYAEGDVGRVLTQGQGRRTPRFFLREGVCLLAEGVTLRHARQIELDPGGE